AKEDAVAAIGRAVQVAQRSKTGGIAIGDSGGQVFVHVRLHGELPGVQIRRTRVEVQQLRAARQACRTFNGQGVINLPGERVLLNVGEKESGPAPAGAVWLHVLVWLGAIEAPYARGGRRSGRTRIVEKITGGEATVGFMIHVQRQANLVQVVLALGLIGRFADLLHGREQQADQDADDSN